MASGTSSGSTPHNEDNEGLESAKFEPQPTIQQPDSTNISSFLNGKDRNTKQVNCASKVNQPHRRSTPPPKTTSTVSPTHSDQPSTSGAKVDFSIETLDPTSSDKSAPSSDDEESLPLHEPHEHIDLAEGQEDLNRGCVDLPTPNQDNLRPPSVTNQQPSKQNGQTNDISINDIRHLLPSYTTSSKTAVADHLLATLDTGQRSRSTDTSPPSGDFNLCCSSRHARVATATTLEAGNGRSRPSTPTCPEANQPIIAVQSCDVISSIVTDVDLHPSNEVSIHSNRRGATPFFPDFDWQSFNHGGTIPFIDDD